MNFWDFFWLLVWSFFFVAYLMILFQIVVDLFRDNSVNGWLKAVWMLALLIVPVVTAVIYLIARGQGMSQRQMAIAVESRQATDQYIKSVAGSSSSSVTDQISSAKNLLDNGAISQAEFDQIKAKALAG